MTHAEDVARYILRKTGPITAMKFQKLCYYAQAWSLVWDERPLFRASIKAWANGPVVPTLYKTHRGKFIVCTRDFPNANPKVLTKVQRETVDAVLGYYSQKSSQWLSDLTHREPPWKDARRGLAPGTRGHREISHAAMAEYYGSL